MDNNEVLVANIGNRVVKELQQRSERRGQQQHNTQ
jgi:hypothetical protein